jgi:hypothetical protein
LFSGKSAACFVHAKATGFCAQERRSDLVWVISPTMNRNTFHQSFTSPFYDATQQVQSSSATLLTGLQSIALFRHRVAQLERDELFLKAAGRTAAKDVMKAVGCWCLIPLHVTSVSALRMFFSSFAACCETRN